MHDINREVSLEQVEQLSTEEDDQYSETWLRQPPVGQF